MKSKTPPNQDPIYMGPSSGPFRCDHCEYFEAPNRCNKAEMIKTQQSKKGFAVVNAGGCCNYFEPDND